MINDNANGTRHQGERKSGHDAAVWYSIFQATESLAEDIEQQRHQTQGGNAGASCHYNAGRVSEREEALLDRPFVIFQQERNQYINERFT